MMIGFLHSSDIQRQLAHVALDRLGTGPVSSVFADAFGRPFVLRLSVLETLLGSRWSRFQMHIHLGIKHFFESRFHQLSHGCVEVFDRAGLSHQLAC